MEMDRRTFVTRTGLTGAAALLAGTAPGALSALAQDMSDTGGAEPASGAQARLAALFDRMFEERLDSTPEMVTAFGLDKGARAEAKRQLSDRSDAREAEELATAKDYLDAMDAIDREALPQASQLDYDVVRYGLERGIAKSAAFDYGSGGGRFAPYLLSQLTGAYQDLPDFLDSQHRVADISDADAYLSRLAAFPVVLDQETARQRDDAAQGVFAPDYILDTTLRQLGSLRDNPAAETVLVTSFRRKLAEADLPESAADTAARIVEAQVFPALDRQRALVEELRAQATHDAGVWRLPKGDEYYAMAVASSTTTDITPEEVHRIGLEQVAEISARIDTILAAEGMTQGSVGERLVALNEREDQLFANTDAGREALLEELREQVAAMEARLPEAFSTLPEADVEVRRVPPHIQAGAPGGYYQSAALDGSRPAAYYINLRDTFDRPKFGLATLTHHEASPGHHLQISLAQESEDIPMIRRGGGYSAYTEGWALYAEQLADEMGMYEGDPLGQVGYLQSLLFRATRLVVDTGLHDKRWSRERATDYFIATTGIARGRSQGEIDRYTVWPGQATSYKIGHTVWTRLRAEVKAAQGDAFDIRAFHDILKLGPMPLSVLERVVRNRLIPA